MTNSMEENKPKEPLVAVLWSLVYPGMGQIYAERWWRGFLFSSTELIVTAASLCYLLHPITRLHPCHLLLIPVSLAYGIFIIVDAYRCAGAWNLDHGLVRKITRGKKSSLITGIFFLVFVLNPMSFTAHYIKSNVVQAFKIPSEAMQPTLIKGDRVLVNKQIYKSAEPERGDLVVFQSPDGPGTFSIKRLAGLPGENLEIKGGRLLINGVVIAKPSALAKLSYVNRGPYGEEGIAVAIPSGHYYVLGDNSSQSHDSRYFGFIPRKSLIGKVYKIYWPPDRSGPIE